MAFGKSAAAGSYWNVKPCAASAASEAKSQGRSQVANSILSLYVRVRLNEAKRTQEKHTGVCSGAP